MNKIKMLSDFFSDKREKSVEDYEKLICDFGLVNDVAPTLYGHHREFMNERREDLGIYQTPFQFARLLKILEKYKINSYAEIGVFRGGTFLFMKYFLHSLNKKVSLHCIDPTDNIHPDAKPFIEPHLTVGTSYDLIGEKFDLVFIDGDHSEYWARTDWENLGQHAKICIFHDIDEPSCRDVRKVWDEVKKGKEFIEILSDGHQGIGILINN